MVSAYLSSLRTLHAEGCAVDHVNGPSCMDIFGPNTYEIDPTMTLIELEDLINYSYH